MPDAHLQRLMVEQHIPGLALIVQAGETRLYEGYHGFANLEHRVPVISETVFEIASVTKLFTTQIILSLVQGGQLDLDSRLIDHLPEFIPTAWAPYPTELPSELDAAGPAALRRRALAEALPGDRLVIPAAS